MHPSLFQSEGRSIGAPLLPYRTNGPDLSRWLEARARGAAVDQPGVLGIAAKSLDGIVEAARSLGLVADASTDLTALGRRFVLAPPTERVGILREAVLGFAPYRLVLDAARERGDAETEAGWIETWWGAHGIGGSQSNRAEAAASLGRLVEHVGLGDYVPGRRGHPTRIRWNRDALEGALAGTGDGGGGRRPAAASEGTASPDGAAVGVGTAATEGAAAGAAREAGTGRRQTTGSAVSLGSADRGTRREIAPHAQGPREGTEPRRAPPVHATGAGERRTIDLLDRGDRGPASAARGAGEGADVDAAAARRAAGARGGDPSSPEDLAAGGRDRDDAGEDLSRRRPGHGSPAPGWSAPRQSRLVLPLSEGRVARLSVPAVLSAAEKRRLLSLVELLVEVREG